MMAIAVKENDIVYNVKILSRLVIIQLTKVNTSAIRKNKAVI